MWRLVRDEHPAWAVAAAILLVEDCALHYEELTRRVRGTKLSGLGRHGRTATNTLRTDIATRHNDIFWAHGGRSGLYQIGDEAAALADGKIRWALRAVLTQELEDYRELLSSIIIHRVNLTENREEFARLDRFEAKFRRLGRFYTPKY